MLSRRSLLKSRYIFSMIMTLRIFVHDVNYVIDMHGKTIIAGADMDYLIATGVGPTATLKNAVIDMNHKTFKTAFNGKGILHLENVSIINSENTNYGVMSWSNNTKAYGNGTVNNEQFVADNSASLVTSRSPQFIQWTPSFVLSELLEANARPSQVRLTECTFNGGMAGLWSCGLLWFDRYRGLHIYRL